MYRKGQLLCCSSREKKTTPSLTPRGKFDWKLADFRTNASAETPYLLIRRQISFCPVSNDRRRIHSKSVSIISERATFPRCENLDIVTSNNIKLAENLE